MVRGTSRRVIVVESPDTNLFEQAIFIVRNDAQVYIVVVESGDAQLLVELLAPHVFRALRYAYDISLLL